MYKERTGSRLRRNSKDKEKEKTVHTVVGEERDRDREIEKGADKSAGPIARLNLIIQAHPISSSSGGRRSPVVNV